MENQSNKKKIAVYAGLTLLAVIMIIPFYWMLISSVKLNKDVFSIPCLLYTSDAADE